MECRRIWIFAHKVILLSAHPCWWRRLCNQMVRRNLQIVDHWLTLMERLCSNVQWSRAYTSSINMIMLSLCTEKKLTEANAESVRSECLIEISGVCNCFPPIFGAIKSHQSAALVHLLSDRSTMQYNTIQTKSNLMQSSGLHCNIPNELWKKEVLFKAYLLSDLQCNTNQN